MKHYFFFAALFPPVFMNTLLVSARPVDLLHYFLAGYFVAMVPALTAAFIDAMLEHKPAVMRAGCCALGALVTAPVLFLAFESATAWQAIQIAICSGLAGFIGTMAYIQLAAVFPKLQDKPVLAKPA
jgi:glucose uptake protein GlcU